MASDRKVSVSFTNWVLGGSLVSLTSTESETRRRRRQGRKVTITEYDSSDNEVGVKEIETAKKSKKGEKKEGDKKSDDKEDAKKNDAEDEKKNEDEGKKKKKKCCKTCGKDKESGDEGEEKKGDVADAKKDDGADIKKDGGSSDKKTDEKKSDDSKGSGDGQSNSGGWTDAQVSKLKEMKKENKSWKSIAADIGHNQGECKSKWKDVQKAEDEMSGGNGETGGASGSEEPSGNAPGGWDAGWENTGNEAGNLSFGDLFVDAPVGGSDKQDNSNSQKHSDGGGRKREGKNGGKEGGGNQHYAGEEGWSYKSNEPSHPRELPSGLLRPNHVWSRDDCEVLEILEAQYREHKWLQIQAGFFNWTGRMISADLIESKFGEDGAA